MSNTVYNDETTRTVKPDAVDKALALIFLNEALMTEEYEGCAALIKKAKRSGARSREISKLLAGAARRVKRRIDGRG